MFGGGACIVVDSKARKRGKSERGQPERRSKMKPRKRRLTIARLDGTNGRTIRDCRHPSPLCFGPRRRREEASGFSAQR